MSGTSVTADAGRKAATVPARRRHRIALAWMLGIAVAAVALFACCLRQSRTVSVGSDGASQALQAWDLLHGNPLLHGWWVTDVSFYTTELPQYALIELARGLTADVIHVAGALTYTLLVLVAACLARGQANGREGVTRALLAAGIMLAPQLGSGTQTLVLSPDHTGTSVPILLVFLLINRAPSRNRYVPVLVWLALAWTALADAMTIFVAIIPLAMVCVLRLVTGLAAKDSRGWREPFASHRHEAFLAVAAVLAVPAELAATALIKANGGWQVNGLRTALASAGQLAGNARLTGEGLLELFGADVFDATGGIGAALAVLHLAGLALAAAGVLLAARRFLRRDASVTRETHPTGDTVIESVLVAGIVIDLAAYLAGVQAVNILSTREIAPVLPFAAVLAGRCLGARLADDQLPGNRRHGDQPSGTWRAVPARALRYVLCAVLAVYAAGLGYAADRPPAASQYADLAAWLRTHHLTQGLSGYHQASIVTLETGGSVTLRPVTSDAHGRLTAYTWNASDAWYDPATGAATFLVLTTPGAPGDSGLTTAQVTATFGKPGKTYRYQAYAILVWPQGTNLLTALRGRAGPGALRVRGNEATGDAQLKRPPASPAVTERAASPGQHR